MIKRVAEETLRQMAKQFRAVAVLGPRQSGKTTLVRYCFPDRAYVSLENPDVRRFALEDPRGFLSQYHDGAIFDEVQRAPELLSYLQQILDETTESGLFILTGSNNFLLQEQISQSLAGRVGYLDLLPLSIEEIDFNVITPDLLDEHLIRGGYPALHAQDVSTDFWFSSYLRTYIERDVRQIKNIENLQLFERTLLLCAGRAGQLVNYSNLANEAGVDYKTIQSWISILNASYHVFLLQPYFKNWNKRIVKSSKLYFYDTGILCYLLGIESAKDLIIHPMRGAIFENFIICEFFKARKNRSQREQLYFWRDRSGHEIDLVVEEGIRLRAFELKSGATVRDDWFRSLSFWKELTGEEDLQIIYGGMRDELRSNAPQVYSWRSKNNFFLPDLSGI